MIMSLPAFLPCRVFRRRAGVIQFMSYGSVRKARFLHSKESTVKFLRGFLVLGAILSVSGFSVGDERPSAPKIVMTKAEKPEDRMVEVVGLPAELLKQLAAWKADDPRLAAWLSVYVGKVPKEGQ